MKILIICSAIFFALFTNCLAEGQDFSITLTPDLLAEKKADNIKKYIERIKQDSFKENDLVGLMGAVGSIHTPALLEASPQDRSSMVSKIIGNDHYEFLENYFIGLLSSESEYVPYAIKMLGKNLFSIKAKNDFEKLLVNKDRYKAFLSAEALSYIGIEKGKSQLVEALLKADLHDMLVHDGIEALLINFDVPSEVVEKYSRSENGPKTSLVLLPLLKNRTIYSSKLVSSFMKSIEFVDEDDKSSLIELQYVKLLRFVLQEFIENFSIVSNNDQIRQRVKELCYSKKISISIKSIEIVALYENEEDKPFLSEILKYVTENNKDDIRVGVLKRVLANF